LWAGQWEALVGLSAASRAASWAGPKDRQKALKSAALSVALLVVGWAFASVGSRVASKGAKSAASKAAM